MSDPSNEEQLLLELINYTRMDPVGATRLYITSYSPLTSGDSSIQSALNYFHVNGLAFETAIAALVPVQPLAWNGALADAAAAHSQLMIDQDTQSHQLTGEAGLGARIAAAGYSYSSVGENIYAYANSMLYAHAGFMVDWGPGTDGMQNPAGHRINLMNAGYREAGLGVIAENNSATSVGPWVVTEDLGRRSNGPAVFVLGVSYTDTNGNAFYSVGEGRSGMSIQTTGGSGTSTSSGGYTLELAAGARTITYSGGGLAHALAVSVDLATGTNAKLDVVGASTVLTSVSLGVVSGVTHVVALGLQNLALSGTAGAQQLDGNAGNNTLSGIGGNDVLNGGAGNDRLVGGNGNDAADGGDGRDLVTGGAGNDNLVGGAGNDNLSGGPGNDTLIGSAGADRFSFDSRLDAATNVDRIDEFVRGSDRILLDTSVFSALAGQTEFVAGQFVSGAGMVSAPTAEARVIYDRTSGNLYYDADGSGSGALPVWFAVVGSADHPNLGAGDFLLRA